MFQAGQFSDKLTTNMKNTETTIWGMHAGRSGEADKLFLKNDRVGMGWSKLKDLAKFKDREEFKDVLFQAYPEKKPGAIPNNAGQLFRFVCEMKKGDLVVYPSNRDKQIHLGEITGDYLYDPKLDSDYPHQRQVRWSKSVPRTHFSQGALYEIGSAMSLFQVKSYSDEFISALEGKTLLSVPTADTSVPIVADDIEQTTQDFILKQLATELKGHPLAEFVGHLLGAMGYRVRVSPEGPDGGIDIIAHKDELGFEPPIVKVQVKSSEGSIGDPAVNALLGNLAPSEFGLFVTIGTFTSQAKVTARNKSNLRLIDGDELVTLILHHYDQLDSRYKGLIPLKRVYVPESLNENEG